MFYIISISKVNKILLYMCIHLLNKCIEYSLCAYAPLPIFDFESLLSKIQLHCSMMCNYALM